MSNPFESPQTDSTVGVDQRLSPYVACPYCSATNAKPVHFTWWGGFLGPKIISCVKCESCCNGYNGKTGKSNFRAMLLYQAAVLLIGLFVIGLIMGSLFVASR